MKILVYEDKGGWFEIEDDLRSVGSPESYIVIGSFSEESSYQTEVISPTISSVDINEVRVIILGYLYNDDVLTDKCIGAYVDVPV